MYYKILFSIFFSLCISEETITQITDIFPSGKPREITLYHISDDINSNFTLLPLKRYIYNPDGQLHKYQEFWNNGQKSIEVLVQRDQIIERHWSIEGFPKDTEKFKKESYNIPSLANKSTKSDASLTSLSTKIEKMKRDLASLSLNVREITSSLNSLDKGDDAVNKLESLVTKNISLLNNEISQLQEQIQILSSQSGKLVNNNDFKEDINKRIDSIENEIKVLKSDTKSTKKKKKRK